MDKPDNGDLMAFPVQASDAQGSLYAEGGLTKRELFAAMAMQGLCANSIPGGQHHPKFLSEEALEQADALLAAFAQRTGSDNG